MSQKLKYTGKNSTSESWRLEDRTYSAQKGVVTANDDHVAPLLATTVWEQVDPSLPTPESPFVATTANPVGDRVAHAERAEVKTQDKTEVKPEPKKDK